MTIVAAALLILVTQGWRDRAVHDCPLQRGRASTPVNADCAAGRLALR
mgnify:CR=1 FL=1